MNFVVFFLTALIPLITGFIWYHPKVFMTPWLRVSGLRQEESGKGRMWLTFLLAYLLSCMLATFLTSVVIHQMHLFSILANEPALKDKNSDLSKYVADFLSKYGQNFRTFKHGAFHGTITALFAALPILGIIALFERRRFAYVAIHTGYWIITIALMGGIICQFLKPY